MLTDEEPGYLADMFEADNNNGYKPRDKKTRYVVRSAADALKPQPPIEYIVDKLVTSGSIGVFYGEPGSKKTYSLLSMAVCVASGISWLGYKTAKSIVLVVDEESGENRLSLRLFGWV
jgi:RecA-family ATPase